MFLKKGWIVQTVEPFFLIAWKIWDQSKRNISKHKHLQENKIKGENQLTKITETVNFLSESFHRFEADRKLKE